MRCSLINHRPTDQGRPWVECARITAKLLYSKAQGRRPRRTLGCRLWLRKIEADDSLNLVS